MSQLDQLNAIHFHDLPLEEIRFKLEYPTEFEMRFLTYDELTRDYDHWSVRFLDVVQLSCDGFSDGPSSHFEIHSFEYKVAEQFAGTIMCLTGEGLPSLTISFTCGAFLLERTDQPDRVKQT